MSVSTQDILNLLHNLSNKIDSVKVTSSREDITPPLGYSFTLMSNENVKTWCKYCGKDVIAKVHVYKTSSIGYGQMVYECPACRGVHNVCFVKNIITSYSVSMKAHFNV